MVGVGVSIGLKILLFSEKEMFGEVIDEEEEDEFELDDVCLFGDLEWVGLGEGICEKGSSRVDEETLGW